MGNGLGKLCACFSASGAGDGEFQRRSIVPGGHSFCYVRPENIHHKETLFQSISGASVSANASTPLSTSFVDYSSTRLDSPAAFESSTSFASIPLQFDRNPVGEPGQIPDKNRGFLSGPIERAFSGPIPVLPRSFSHGDFAVRKRSGNLTRLFQKVKASRGIVTPWEKKNDVVSRDINLNWAQGKAGEDRVHVVVSEEEHGWVFVAIYDGFNGPDAPDYLLSNLYPAIRKNLDESPDQSVQSVLNSLAEGLMKTEEAYFEIADMMLDENPELALMGSCVLVMVMKGEDVYLMNIGDSRAVLACETGVVQLTNDHSTSVEDEIRRIRDEHPEDSSVLTNDRVKGSLKVTRAFGAGFLKQAKWNNALLEMFRIDYIGSSPYITSSPSLLHRRLTSGDRFLVLSSDGLYQYFTNEEVISKVGIFLASSPDGDPAQHLVEELLFRAAKKAGMDFHELLEIPQGDRRRYHDDVSVVVISFQGRI